MHPAAETFFALSPERKKDAHLKLGRMALDAWHTYSRFRFWLSYADSVVGLPHRVDRRLPFDAFLCATKGKDTLKVAQRYMEPIAALQDDDLNLPERAEYAYYTIYNLFRKYVAGDDIDDWLIVNQALSTQKDMTKVAGLLEEAVK